MNNYFIPGLSPDKKLKLEAHGIACYDFTIGAEQGLMIEDGYLQPALELLGARIVQQAASDYEGIERVVIDDSNLPAPMLEAQEQGTPAAQQPAPPAPVSPNHTASAGAWDSCNRDGMVSIARQILLPYLQRDLVVSIARGVAKAVDDGRFHIHIFSSYQKCRAGVRPPAQLFGIPVDCGDSAFPATGYGVAISDGAYAVAELIGKDNLYIHHNLVKTGSINEERIFAEVLHRVRPLVAASLSEDQQRRLFVDECCKALSRALPEATGEDDNGKQMRETASELSKHVRLAQSEELKILRNETVDVNSFGDEYLGLLRVKKVKDVRVEDGKIVVYTDVLKARDERNNNWHEIGAFKIELNPLLTSPRWHNLTRRINAMRELQHAPHIWQDGSACLGNSATIFQTLFQERQWSVAAQLAIEFAESANTADPAGKYVHHWPATTAPAKEQNVEREALTLDPAHEQHKQAYVQACAARVDELVKQARESVVAERKEIEQLQTQLVKHIRARQIRARRKAGKPLCDRQEFARMYDQLRQMPRVKNVRVEPGVIFVTTQALSSDDPRSGHRHTIGEMELRLFIDGQADMIRWTNLSGAKDCCRKQQQSPLVLRSGRACICDIREAYPDMIANFQFSDALQLALDFIEQTDVEHPAGKHITSWPTANPSEGA